jgi:hypothetical protein
MDPSQKLFQIHLSNLCIVGCLTCETNNGDQVIVRCQTTTALLKTFEDLSFESFI